MMGENSPNLARVMNSPVPIIEWRDVPNPAFRWWKPWLPKKVLRGVQVGFHNFTHLEAMRAEYQRQSGFSQYMRTGVLP